MYLNAFRGRPWIRIPGAAIYSDLAGAVLAAKQLYGAVPVPIAILSGPADPLDPAYYPRPTTIALDERAWTEIDAITRFSWAGNAAGSRYTVAEFAVLLAAVPFGPETAFGSFPGDNSYVLTVRANNPAPAAGAVTGAEGISYDYSAALIYDPQSDGMGDQLAIPDLYRSINADEPNATLPDPTPGLPAAPSAAEVAAGAVPVWQWRVLTLAGILAGDPAPAWADPGPAEFGIGRWGAGEPFRLEVQDRSDEAATTVYHGPNQSAGLPPPPGISGIWRVDPATGFYGQYITVTKPAGQTWAADGGRLISISWGGSFATPDGLYTSSATRVPPDWFGPVDLTYPRADGVPITNSGEDPNARSSFVSVYDAIGGNTKEAPVFAVYAVARYGLGEPRRWHSTGRIAGGGGTYGVNWDHTFAAASPPYSMGTQPGTLPPAPIKPPAAPLGRQLPDNNGCIGSHNAAGLDPETGEYYISGDRNRLRFGGRPGIIPEPDAGIITDDGGTRLGAFLETLTGTPCTQLGIGLGFTLRAGRPAVTAGLFLEVGTGGPMPIRIPI